MWFSTPTKIGSVLPLHVGTKKATRGRKKVRMEKAASHMQAGTCASTHLGLTFFFVPNRTNATVQ